MRWLVLILCGVVLAAPRTVAQDIPGRGQAALALRSAAMLHYRSDPDASWGKVCSAVVLAAQQALTAAHCLTRRGEYRLVAASGAVLPVAAIRDVRGKDAAVLSFEGPIIGARPAPLAASVALGDHIWIAGAPGGTTAEIVVLAGRIARVQDDYRFTNAPEQGEIGTDPQQVLWLDARVTYGSSGAGVLNDHGQLVGLVVRVYAVGSVLAQTPFLGFAVGLDTLREVLRCERC